MTTPTERATFVFKQRPEFAAEDRRRAAAIYAQPAIDADHSPAVVLRVHDRINFIPGGEAIRIATEIADALQAAKES